MVKEVQLNDKQREAVEWDEGPLLVLAGPGTGKTQLLSARVERILTQTDAAPETILCLTFTESGAENIRERLLRTIGQDARKVNIFTYHAFGATILSAYQNYTEKPERRLDETIDDVMKYKIVRQIQAGLPAMDILRGDDTNALVSTIESAKSARLAAEDLARIAEVNQKQSAEISSEISPVMDQILPRMKFDAALPIYEEILAILLKYSSPEEIAPRIEPLANEMARELDKIIKEQGAAEKPSVKDLSAWRKDYFEKDDDDCWRVKGRVANLKLASLARVMAAYEEKLSAAGLYDYADMIELAIKYLREDRGFRLTMSERFQHILLDEFQDTNPSQFEIIRLLCDYEKPDVMAVGDDDQAIFEFQGANASNLYDFQAHFSAHLVNLEQNYRSYGEIVDTAKRVSEQIQGSFARQSGVEKLLKAFRGMAGVTEAGGPENAWHFRGEPAPGRTPAVTRHEFLSSDAEYYWVAEQIAGLVASGVEQKDIAVIMPKHKRIAPLLPYLKAHPEIRIAYEKRDNLFLDPKIAELLTLARFVHEMAKAKPAAGRLLEILAFPFWGIRPLVAIRAVSAARADKKAALDYLAESGDEDLVRLAEFLAALVMKSYDTPLELMLDYMTGTAPIQLPSGEYRSPFLGFYTQSGSEYAGFELYENLATFREQLVRHTKTEAPRLSDLIDFCDDFAAAGAALANTSPYRDSDNAVQILTAHKSKGLEFAYVFMMSVDSQAWGRAKGNNDRTMLPKNVRQIRHTGQTEDEQKRLLFVAMTRARDALIMTNSLKDFAGKSALRLEYLAEAAEEGEDGKARVISPYLPAGAQEVQLHYGELEDAMRQTNLATYWSAAYCHPEPELRTLLKEKMQSYRLSASDLTTFIDLTYAGPMEFFRRKVLSAPSDPPTESQVYGNIIHAVFEQVTNEGISDEEAAKLYQAEVDGCDLEEEERRVLMEKGSVALSVVLEEFRHILRSPRGRGEVNLGPAHPSFAGVPITGKIDHIEVDPEAKTIELYDFKTGSYHKEKWGSHGTLFKYSLQLSFYKYLLLASPEYAGYKVTRGHILFVTPDAEMKVYDKPYDFELSDEYMSALMRAVFEQAQSLEFLDDPELKLEPDASRKLADIKQFIESLTLKVDKK